MVSQVAALFCRSDSNYRDFDSVDVWDAERDARRWPGGCSVIAHPPCRAWGQLRAMANAAPGEKELALLAVKWVREFGGVLEHPKKSTLWPEAGLPEPGQRDKFGGWTLPINQFWWGHRAEKATRLYIVGCEPTDIPDIPIVLGDAPCLVGTSGRRKDGKRLKKGDDGWRPEISKAEREHTPPLLAEWLVKLARKCEANKVELKSEAAA